MNKTKLLLYGDYYKKPSGFAREFRDLIPLLLKKGYDIRQIALGFNGLPEDDQIKIYPGKFYKLDSYWAREMLEYALEDFKPDIILTLGDYYMLPKIAFAMAYPRKGKWIHWGVQDGAPLGFGCHEPLKWVDYNLYHSEFAKIEVKKIFPDINGEVFFPATNPDIFYEMDKEKLRKEFGCENNFVITTVARNQTRKNLPALLQAMPLIKKDIPEAMLLLGLTHDTTTPEGAKEGHEIQYLIDYYNINDCVVMPREKSKDGSLSDKTIREIYNMGDIFCLMSMGEGFGMIFHESMACGVPCISTDCSAIPYTLNEYGYLVEPRASFCHSDGVSQAVVHYVDIFKKVVEVYNNKELWLDKKRYGQQFVSNFTPENRVEILDGIFKKVIKNNYYPLISK